MDTKQMNYILTIARESSIRKAAEKLFITQSALDQQLLKLEGELGTALFYRSRSNLSLTPAGKVYVEYAKQMMELKDEAYHIISDLANKQRGTLTLAFAPERGMEMFADVYPKFYEVYPYITVIPREVGVKRQLEMLQNDELNLGFLPVKEDKLPGLTCIPVCCEEFVLITPLNHPLAKLAAPPGEPFTRLDISSVKNSTFSLIYRESSQWCVIAPLFKQAGIDPHIFLETASNRANISMVQQGLSCSIVPFHYVKSLQNVACFCLSERPEWNLMACYRQNRYLSKAAQHFIRLAEEHFSSQPSVALA